LRKISDPIVEEFLSSQTKRSTYFTYSSHMKLYLEFTQKSGKELIDMKKNDTDFEVEKTIFQYRKWLLEKGKSEYYAASSVGGIRGFYSYFRLPLTFRRTESKKLSEKNRSTEDYHFDREDLTKMALAGSLKERYVLLMGKSVGLRVGDFLSLTYGQFRCAKLDSEPPVALGEIGTVKEKVKTCPFLDSDAVPIAKAWLESHREAKDSARMIDDTENNLSIILQNLCQKAGMNVDFNEKGEGLGTIHGKRVRFHCLRKFLIDRLSAYASESQWKQIVGKAIGEGAYVSQDQLRGIFARAMKDMVINGNGIKVKKLVELESALLDSQKRLTNIEVTNEVLRKELNKVNSDLETVTNALKGLKPIIDNMDEVIEFIEKRQEEKELQSRAEGDAEESVFREKIQKETTEKK
jgi:hypothetical protein